MYSVLTSNYQLFYRSVNWTPGDFQYFQEWFQIPGISRSCRHPDQRVSRATRRLVSERSSCGSLSGHPGRGRPAWSCSVGLLLLPGLQRRDQIAHQCDCLFLLRRRNHRPQRVDDVLRLAEVDLIQRVADLVLHVLAVTHTHRHADIDTCPNHMHTHIHTHRRTPVLYHYTDLVQWVLNRILHVLIITCTSLDFTRQCGNILKVWWTIS